MRYLAVLSFSFALQLNLYAWQEYACCEFSANKKPLWETALFLPRESPEGECDWSYAEQHVAYTSPQAIVVGFHLDCLQRHVPPVRIHTLDLILQIDAQSGKVLNQVQWRDVSIRRNWAGDLRILAGQGGRFLVLVGPSLKLFSPEFRELKSRPLTQDKVAPEENWTVPVSSDGRTGFLSEWSHRSTRGEDHWFSVDTLDDDLAEPAALEENWRSVQMASAVFFLPFHSPSKDRKEVVHIRERGQQQARPLCAECDGFPVAVVPDGLLLLATGPKASFMLVTPEGKIAHRAAYGKGVDSISREHVVTASAALRFAFSFGHLQGRLFSWGSVDTIVVFDTRKMADVFQLNIKQQPERYSSPYIKGEHWPGEAMALSPDGARVAVLSGAVLKLFQIPQP